MITSSYKLHLLRQQMAQYNIDFYLVPSIDAHNNEYVPECWQRRAWISGFTGSAGEVLVTQQYAYLWTDGRYFLQAEKQLEKQSFTLMRQNGLVPEIAQWLEQNGHGLKLAVDPKVISIKRARHYKQIMEKIGGECVFIETNLIDVCREKIGESIELPFSDAFHLSNRYSGRTTAQKLSDVQAFLKDQSIDYFVFNVLDEIGWLLNIRGNDIAFNPLVISYAVVGQNQSFLFVDHRKLSHQIRQDLADNEVEVKPYDKLGDFLYQLENHVIGLDENTANYWLASIIEKHNTPCFKQSPVLLPKARKNHIEVEGAFKAHEKDAVAVINLLHWLSQNWRALQPDELEVIDKLYGFRQQMRNFMGPSFDTICGYQENGAIIHYRATSETSKKITDQSLLLIDSGGQYLEGTTDITRTIHLGEPTETQKTNYTQVLKGHLALANAIFPARTCGEHLDALARYPLWQYCLNYPHGTGHGVGSFLCVHEGPQRVSPGATQTPLEPGMIISNEPGFYKEGHYGIRIENLCVTQHHEDSNNQSDFGPFYHFDNLTLVPYARKLIDVSLLNATEIKQIQSYYKRIRKAIRPHLGDEQKQWLDHEIDWIDDVAV